MKKNLISRLSPSIKAAAQNRAAASVPLEPSIFITLLQVI